MNTAKGKMVPCAILLLFLQSCSFAPHSPWCLEVTQTWCSDYRSARIFLPSKTMGMEFVRGTCGIRMYLNLMICPLPVESDEIEFSYTIGTVKYLGTAWALEGGQRILVSGHDMAVMTEALREGSPVRVILGMYDECFESANFPSLFFWLESWRL